MAVQAVKERRVACMPRAQLRRCFLSVRAPGSFRSPAREQQEAAHLPLAKPSEHCPWLDPRRGTLTIPISAAVEALQSNEVYLPRMRQRQGRTLSARQISAVPWIEVKGPWGQVLQ